MPFKKGYTPWNKGLPKEKHPFYGKHHSKETKQKISEKKKGMRCSPKTEFKKGHQMLDSTKEKIRQYQLKNDNAGRFRVGHAPKNHFPLGNIPWNKGIKTGIAPSTVFKKGTVPWNKNRVFKEISGDKHWNWNGGISNKKYGDGWTPHLRRTVRKRDNYMCQICGLHQEELNNRLSIHHIDYDKNNNHMDNLKSLCISCHVKLHVSTQRRLDDE